MEDTIVAPATPRGVSALAAVRVSGAAVKSVLAALFKDGRPQDRVARFGTARNPATGDAIDSLVYVYYEGPRSYTGEDSLEVFPHGNPLIVRSLVQAMCGIPGVRLAEPGEYTRRAFLNGKMDLVQAEAVADVIHSTNASGLANARRLLSGRFSECVRGLSERVREMSSRMELEVDFVEEEADADVSGWRVQFSEIQKTLRSLIENFRSAESENKLPRAVLYGAPNAGKSSLMNALLHDDRVLVSEIPGTTRDYVEVPLTLDGGEIRLVDTAGLADTPQDALDARSMEKSRSVLGQADLGILLVDARGFNSDVAQKAIAAARAQGRWIIASKTDLALGFEIPPAMDPAKTFAVSSKTGAGLDSFRSALSTALFPPHGESEEFWVTSERQCECLRQAEAGVERILHLIDVNPAVELIAFELRGVRDSLASIIGEISSEDILQNIFSKFCIGK